MNQPPLPVSKLTPILYVGGIIVTSVFLGIVVYWYYGTIATKTPTYGGNQIESVSEYNLSLGIYSTLPSSMHDILYVHACMYNVMYDCELL